MRELLSHSYNLARLGNAGDAVAFAADVDQRAALAQWAGLLSLDRLEVQVTLHKLDATSFGLDYAVTADLAQACVVTLEPVPAHLATSFTRELHFVGGVRRKQPESARPEPAGDVFVESDLDEGPEEIDSLHYDLAGPALEEFVLALEPYPRCPGVEFQPPAEGMPPRESPFAALKSLKSEP